MKKRKLIGVILSKVTTAYQTSLLKGIMEQAYELDMDIAVFSTFIKNTGTENFHLGERNIFNLINYDMLDGILFVPTTMGIKDLADDLKAEILRHKEIPTIAIDVDDSDFDCVCMNDTPAFEQIVNHFIEVHNFKKIYCLTGYKDNSQAENRLKGYKNALIKHNIPINNDYIFYGDYWKAAATNLANSIAKGEIERPEAVACANDIMAITLCNALIENGIRVPEDIAVSGYDASLESKTNIPSITSYQSSAKQTGIDAVVALYEKISGKIIEPCIKDYGTMEIAYSCGCGEGDDYIKRNRLKADEDDAAKIELFKNSYMNEGMSTCRDLNGLEDRIVNYSYLIDGISGFILCLNEDPFNNKSHDFLSNNIEDTDYRKVGYSAYLKPLVMYNNGVYMSENYEPFSSKDLLPSFFFENEYPTTFFFAPVHFIDRCFGYSMLNFGPKIKVYNEIYRNWTKNVNNALEFIRVRTRLEMFNKSLYYAYTRDSLTGVYNRHGLEKIAPCIINNCIKENKKILFVLADINGLKHINDTYGHIEGDNAIKVFAEACDKVSLFGEKVIRIGGDEFIAIGCGDYKESAIYEYVDKVNKELNEYNTNSQKPYKVVGSFGAVCDYVSNITESKNENEITDILISKTDKLMYHQKLERRNRDRIE